MVTSLNSSIWAWYFSLFPFVETLASKTVWNHIIHPALLPQTNKNKPWIHKHTFKTLIWNSWKWYSARTFSVLVEMLFLLGSLTFAYSSKGTKGINMEKKNQRLLTLNSLFMFISHLYCDFNQKSPDVATASFPYPGCKHVLSWVQTQPPVWLISLRGSLLMGFCCPPAQPDVNISQE